MIKDFKGYDLIDGGQIGVGVASVVVPMSVMKQEFGLEVIADSMDLKMKSDKLGVFSIVTNYPDKDGVYRKELMVYCNP